MSSCTCPLPKVVQSRRLPLLASTQTRAVELKVACSLMRRPAPYKRRRVVRLAGVGSRTKDFFLQSNEPAAVSPNVSDTISHTNTSPPSPSPLLAAAQLRMSTTTTCQCLADGSPLTPVVLGHIRKLAKENTSLREELTSAMRKTITIESVKQNDKKFSAAVCSGLPNYDAFEVLCDHLGPKQKHLGPMVERKARVKLLCYKKKKETESTPLSICSTEG